MRNKQGERAECWGVGSPRTERGRLAPAPLSPLPLIPQRPFLLSGMGLLYTLAAQGG